MLPGRNQRRMGFIVIVLCRLMKKDVSGGAGVCVIKASSPATQRSTDTQGQAGKPE